jgi:hypothetical protein
MSYPSPARASFWHLGARILDRIGNNAVERANRRAMSGLNASLLKDIGWPADTGSAHDRHHRLPL